MMRRLKVSVNSVIQLKSLCEEWEESVCTEKRKPQIFKKKEVSIKVFQVQSSPSKNSHYCTRCSLFIFSRKRIMWGEVSLVLNYRLSFCCSTILSIRFSTRRFQFSFAVVPLWVHPPCPVAPAFTQDTAPTEQNHQKTTKNRWVAPRDILLFEKPNQK